MVKCIKLRNNVFDLIGDIPFLLMYLTVVIRCATPLLHLYTQSPDCIPCFPEFCPQALILPTMPCALFV